MAQSRIDVELDGRWQEVEHEITTQRELIKAISVQADWGKFAGAVEAIRSLPSAVQAKQFAEARRLKLVD
jgi:hypothetical protein